MANETSGRLIDVGIGLEAEGARGTAVAPDYWIGKLDLDLEDTPSELVSDESSYGTLNTTAGSFVAQQIGEGGWQSNIGLDHFGVILKMLLGNVDTSETAGVYTHTFTELQSNIHPSATIAKYDNVQDLRFALASLDNLTINFEVDNYVNYEAEFQTKKSEAGAGNTPANTKETLFVPHHFKAFTASDVDGLDSADEVNIQNLTLDFAKNLEPKQNLGVDGADVEDFHVTNLEITGSMEVYYNSTTYKDRVFNNGTQALRVKLENTDTQLSDDSNPYLQFDFAKITNTDWEIGQGNDDIVMETVEFTAHYDIDEGKTYSAELHNEVEEYSITSGV